MERRAARQQLVNVFDYADFVGRVRFVRQFLPDWYTTVDEKFIDCEANCNFLETKCARFM